MSNKVKSGIYFGLGMTLIFIFQTIIAWITGEEESTNEIIKSVTSAIIAGGFAGIIFGFMTDILIVDIIFKRNIEFNLEDDETVILKTAANYFKGIDSVGGSLCLTNTRLLFKSDNDKKIKLSIPLADINTTDRFKILAIITSGLVILINDKEAYKFIVNMPNKWTTNIEKAKNGLQQKVLRQQG